MNTETTTTTIEIIEPAILSQNTFYWKPDATASGRHHNEKKRLAEVAAYLRAVGFEITEESSEVASGAVVSGTKGKCEVRFTYAETCSNVYKKFVVEVDGVTKDIRAFRKAVNAA